MNNSEGYVKYHARHTEEPAFSHPLWERLNAARTRLHDLGLVGVLPDGTGYGNVSVRICGDEFLISGTSTGRPRVLAPEAYCRVISFDLNKNAVVSAGPVKASSESMTHGAVYAASPRTRCVLHVHSRRIFDGMLRDGFPATPQGAEYGTPEMARAVSACVLGCAGQGGKADGTIVLTGHDEGLAAYGSSIEKALALVEELYEKYGGI
jgi:hypothetical protein